MGIEIRGTAKKSPLRAIIYGRDGVGKSTFCAGAPGVVFVSTESGLDAIDTRAVDPPTSWRGVIEAVRALRDEPTCKTIVVDSLDWAEQMCWDHICIEGDEKGAKKSIEAFGYGKGYMVALVEWRRLIRELDLAHASGRTILLIAHAERKSVKNPAGDDYDAYQIKLHATAASLLREWVDVVGYADLDIAIEEKDGRSKGVTTGKRVLRTQPSPAYVTKTRYQIASRLPLTWDALSSAIEATRPVSVEMLATELRSKLSMISDISVTKACEDYLAANGNSVESMRNSIATLALKLNKQASVAQTEKVIK